MASSQISVIEVIEAERRGSAVSMKSSALVDVFPVQHPPLPVHVFELAMFQLVAETALEEHLLPLLALMQELSPFPLAGCSYSGGSD